MEMWAGIYTQRKTKVDGREVAFYLIQTSIGNIAIVDYEMPSLEIKRKIFDENYDKAEAYYEAVVRKIVSGKI